MSALPATDTVVRSRSSTRRSRLVRIKSGTEMLPMNLPSSSVMKTTPSSACGALSSMRTASGRRGMVLEQLAQLVLLVGRHHVEHRLAPFLVQLAQQVGRVVRRHALEDLRRVLVGL